MRRVIPITTTITAILIAVYHKQILDALMILIYAIIIMLILGCVIIGFLGYWYISEKMKGIRAERRMLEKESHVTVVTNQGQTFIRDTDPKANWRAAHMDARIYANGNNTEPNSVEQRTWQTFNAPSKLGLLNEPEHIQPTIELLPALDDMRLILIHGSQGTGKTTLLQALAARRQQTSQIIVIDPHAAPSSWLGCSVLGAGENYDEIAFSLERIIAEKEKRYREIGQGIVEPDGHQSVTIVIDEWRDIVYYVGTPAKEAFRRLLTSTRKASMSIIVATHTDRAKTLGLEGEYDLKDGFTVVKLTLVSGIRQATVDFGEGAIPATLPIISTSIEQNPEPILLEVQPSEQEQLILSLKTEGKTISAIAIAVFGSKGGHQNKKVKTILAKYAEKETA